jgi:hypothetical protein
MNVKELTDKELVIQYGAIKADEREMYRRKKELEEEISERYKLAFKKG